MYKGSAYSGYPFLMLSDPYLPNGSMSPLVSSSSPYGEVLWPLSLLKYVAVIVQAPTPISEIAGDCSVQAQRKSSGKGEEMLGRKHLLRSEFAGGAAFPVCSSSRFGFTLPGVKSLYLMEKCPFFWVTSFGGSSSWSLCLCSGICPAAELVC